MSNCPAGSKRRARGARDSGITRRARTKATTPTGTFTQNTDRHPAASTSTPPTIGPSAMLTPTTAAHAPMARARSAGSRKVLTMIDIATGFSIDPPMAWTHRKASNNGRLGASPQASDGREGHQADPEDPPASEAVAERTGEHQ